MLEMASDAFHRRVVRRNLCIAYATRFAERIGLKPDHWCFLVKPRPENTITGEEWIPTDGYINAVQQALDIPGARVVFMCSVSGQKYRLYPEGP